MDDDDRRLFEHYLQSGGPDAGPWNRSPRCLYLEYWTRNQVVERFSIFSGVRVCNVGIGAGEWDNFLCDWLNGKGRLTSIDIDPATCSLFAYRQKREGHPNPAIVVCADILAGPLRADSFDLVTVIGSTAEESGDQEGCLTACWQMVCKGGRMLYMDFVRCPPKQFEAWAAANRARILNRIDDALAEGYIFWSERV